jgi:hypothetical protein
MDNAPTPDADNGTVEGRVVKYVTIAIATPGNPFSVHARGELAQVKADLEESHRERVSFDGTDPLNEMLHFSIPVNQLDNVIAVYEQIVVLTTDPRKAGMHTTPSGIHLPGGP